MPLNNKGQKIMNAMQSEYGSDKGKQVFYASKNKGNIEGVEAKKVSMAQKIGNVAKKTIGRVGNAISRGLQKESDYMNKRDAGFRKAGQEYQADINNYAK